MHDYPAWTQGDPLLETYFDQEWCKENHDDRFQFEMLCLEGASCGLSWRTILHKRENYRRAFHNFDIEVCAQMKDDELLVLMEDEGLIRNKNKIFSVRRNARAVLKIQQAFGTFDAYLFAFVDGNPIPACDPLPAETRESQALSKDLKKRGFAFVGSVITYSFMQAIGMVKKTQAPGVGKLGGQKSALLVQCE